MSRNWLPVWEEGREEPGRRTLENCQLEERHSGFPSSCCSSPKFSSSGLGFPSPRQACHHAHHLWYQAPKQCVIPRTLSSLILKKMGRLFSRH